MPIGNSRISRSHSPSLRNWEAPPPMLAERMRADAELEMGWGRLIFGHTFEDMEVLADRLRTEPPGTRNIAFYLRDPHVLLASSPQEFFLDPSHTFRLWAHQYRTAHRIPRGITIRRLATLADAGEANRILAARSMVTWDPEYMVATKAEPAKVVFLAESTEDGQLVGTVTGVDHVRAFDDPENGSSLWCLAVDPQAKTPGVGLALVRHLVEHYFTRGRQYVDLSVMHDNHQAIALYQKLGFRRVPVFAVKLKNAINEALFTAPEPEERLNPYARIIVDEARRRGIAVEIVDSEIPLFRLELGGRAVTCHESLSELTSSIAFLRCDDKRLTRRVLAGAGLRVPAQQAADGAASDRTFLEEHGRIVVKPARGEQGRGVSVDVRTVEDLQAAYAEAATTADEVVLEEYIDGEDLRVIVIGNEMVAAAVRRPPRVVGNGKHDLRTLVEKYNRRREAATGGESRVPPASSMTPATTGIRSSRRVKGSPSDASPTSTPAGPSTT